MTENQAKWAAQHDWFIDSKESGGEWAVTVRADADDPDFNRSIKFTDYVALREWAGY